MGSATGSPSWTTAEDRRGHAGGGPAGPGGHRGVPRERRPHDRPAATPDAGRRTAAHRPPARRRQHLLRRIHALRGITLEVHPGEIVTLIGANGAGKTTTLRTISGLLPTPAGRVRGRDISRLPPHELVTMGIGHAPEGRRIFSRLTVFENLLMGGVHARPRPENEDRSTRSTSSSHGSGSGRAEGRHAVRRRAADARDRARPDDPPAAPPPRRAVAGPGADPRRSRSSRSSARSTGRG